MLLLGSAHKETKHMVNDQWSYCVISELKSELMNYFLEYDNLPLCFFVILDLQSNRCSFMNKQLSSGLDVFSPCTELHYSRILPIPESFLVPSEMISIWSPSTS